MCCDGVQAQLQSSKSFDRWPIQHGNVEIKVFSDTCKLGVLLAQILCKEDVTSAHTAPLGNPVKKVHDRDQSRLHGANTHSLTTDGSRSC